jgi:hypothetical protein
MSLCVMGVFRKQPKQGSPGDWISPVQMASTPAGPGGSGARPVPVRLRPVSAAKQGDWLPGALRLSQGSLLWEPEAGTAAAPVELAAATLMQFPVSGRRGQLAMVTGVRTPAGDFQLEMDPELFEMSQELVNGTDNQQDPSGPW